MIAIGSERLLGYKALILFMIRNMLPVAILFSLSIALQMYGELIAPTFGAFAPYTTSLASVLYLAATGCFVGVFVVTVLQYFFYTFSMEELDFKMKKGVLFRTEITIPYRQMQDVDIYRNPGHLVLGLSRLTLITAGHEADDEPDEMTEIVLDPIECSVADEIRQILSHKIGVQVIEEQKVATAQ